MKKLTLAERVRERVRRDSLPRDYPSLFLPTLFAIEQERLQELPDSELPAYRLAVMKAIKNVSDELQVIRFVDRDAFPEFARQTRREPEDIAANYVFFEGQRALLLAFYERHLENVTLRLATLPESTPKKEPENLLIAMLPEGGKFDRVREFLEGLNVQEGTGKMLWPYDQNDLRHFVASVVALHITPFEPNKFAAEHFVWKSGKGFTAKAFGRIHKKEDASPTITKVIASLK